MARTNINIRIADWEKDQAELATIRQLVFIDEQHVPEQLEWDEFDTGSTHFIVTIDNRTIASARLKPDGQIGRMAVRAEYRNQGIGNKLLEYVLQYAASSGLDHVYLHAQMSAIPFYEKHDFSAIGGIFYEAGIPHKKMLLKI
jgi:predicted GNAT family N-acyltransferase